MGVWRLSSLKCAPTLITSHLNGRKNAGFAPPSLSIASNFAPLNEALYFWGYDEV